MTTFRSARDPRPSLISPYDKVDFVLSAAIECRNDLRSPGASSPLARTSIMPKPNSSVITAKPKPDLFMVSFCVDIPQTR